MVIGQHGIGEKRQEGPAWITRGLSCLTADLRLGSSPMMYPLFLPALFQHLQYPYHLQFLADGMYTAMAEGTVFVQLQENGTGTV